MNSVQKVWVVDSHTEGEPTRVVVKGGPKLSGASLQDRVHELRDLHDGFRSGVVCEPRGADAVVGALLCEPLDGRADAAVIFFNNVGYLGMCGHGTIGVVETLRYLGRITPGEVKIETPVGLVRAILHADHRVSVFNVRSYRFRKAAAVQVPGYGEVVGDIAYGGNWFFLASSSGCDLSMANLRGLLDFTCAIRHALDSQEIRGENGAQIDHIELFGPAGRQDADIKNFVLCPGLAYDRSPCGTGTSAKLACLAADGKLSPGQLWRQESILGTMFEGSYVPDGDGVLPCITGRAHVTAEGALLFSPEDPLREGIVS